MQECNDKASCPFSGRRLDPLDCPIKARQLLDYRPEIVLGHHLGVEKLDKR